MQPVVTYTPMEITSDYEVLKNVLGILILFLVAVFLVRLYAKLYRNN